MCFIFLRAAHMWNRRVYEFTQFCEKFHKEKVRDKKYRWRSMKFRQIELEKSVSLKAEKFP